MPLTVADLRKAGVLDELARVFDRDDKARELLECVDFPAPRRPVFTHASSFWQEVCAEIENGLTKSSLERLLSEAYRIYEGNEVFRNVAHRRVDEPEIRRYREMVTRRRRYLYAETRALFMPEGDQTNESIELKDVFVETLLRPIHMGKKKERSKRAQGEREEEATEDHDRPGTEQKAVPIGQLLRRERSLVIIGPPGSGKSTLLRCLAVALCQPDEDNELLDTGLPPQTVPVLLELRRFAADLKEQLNCQLIDSLMKHSKVPGLKELLESGRALVLLDGLDEVFNENHRRIVVDEIEELMAFYPQARLVLTSRPYGYQATTTLLGPIPRFEMVPFDDQQIEHFFRGCFDALSRLDAEAFARENPQQRAQALTVEVLARPPFRKMARNPLLCTLIVMVHRLHRGYLPKRRAVFYEHAVKTLVDCWETSKHFDSSPDRDEIPEPEIIIQTLSEVAWRALHELDGWDIPGDRLRAWLLDSLADITQWSGRIGQQQVKHLLESLLQRTGLLVELGADRYKFVHLSVHEYLAAHYIINELADVQSQRVIFHYLHAPRWEEVLRLAVASPRADLLVRTILDHASSPWERMLCRDLRFVCRCLGDEAPMESFKEEFHRRLTQALTDHQTLDMAGLIEDAAGAGATKDHHRIVKDYLAHDDDILRHSAVEYFSRVTTDHAQILDAFTQGLHDKNPRLRLSAVEYFDCIRAHDPETRKAIHQRLVEDVDQDVRYAASEYFTHIDPNDRETRHAFFQMLANDDYQVRRNAIEHFVRLGEHDRDILNEFIKRLENENFRVRCAAVDYFNRIKAYDAETRKAVAQRLADHEEVRHAAVEYFARIETNATQIRKDFFHRLEDHDFRVRHAAIEYFVRIDAFDIETQSSIAQKVEDQKYQVRRAAVWYFTSIGTDNTEIQRLIEYRLTDPDLGVRRNAIEYFARLARRDNAVCKEFLKKLVDTDFRVRRGAIEFFTRIRANDAATRKAIDQRLADEDYRVRTAAIEYYTEIQYAEPAVQEMIVQTLQHEDDESKIAAIRYFNRIGHLSAMAEFVWEAFQSVSGSTSPGDDQAFSTMFGKLAAADQSLLDLMLHRGPATPNFRMDLALAAAASELDHRRRHEQPLDLL